MRRAWLLGLATIAVAVNAWAATLTITPDQEVYQVGDTLRLNVFGDAQGGTDNRIYGRIRFDAALAQYVVSQQQPLTSNLGFKWITGPLTGGAGFGEAFSQFPGDLDTPSGPLLASVTLQATAPGTLDYSWQTDGDLDFRLDFFGLTNAPGGSVVIVPEVSSGALLGMGVAAIAIQRRRVGRD